MPEVDPYPSSPQWATDYSGRRFHGGFVRGDGSTAAGVGIAGEVYLTELGGLIMPPSAGALTVEFASEVDASAVTVYANSALINEPL